MQIRQTEICARWFVALRDVRAKARIDARIRRISLGNFGDAKPVGGGVSELRVNYGPVYRIYFARRGDDLVLLLNGGDKARQQGDIARARQFAASWKDA